VPLKRERKQGDGGKKGVEVAGVAQIWLILGGCANGIEGRSKKESLPVQVTLTSKQNIENAAMFSAPVAHYFRSKLAFP
jgi:hypothetical protein